MKKLSSAGVMTISSGGVMISSGGVMRISSGGALAPLGAPIQSSCVLDGRLSYTVIPSAGEESPPVAACAAIPNPSPVESQTGGVGR